MDAIDSVSGARLYHEESKHSRRRIAGAPILDRSDEPAQVKAYPDAPRLDLPGESMPLPDLTEVITSRGLAKRAEPGVNELATLLRLGYGATLRQHYAGREFVFRAAPSAGALYPAELYLCCGPGEGLDAGIYYYDPARDCVSRILEGDQRSALAEVLCGGLGASAYLLITAYPWKSAWKYGNRAYRYCLMDAGHLAANLLLIGCGLGLRPELTFRIDENRLNRLLGLDGETEFPVAAVAVSPGDETQAEHAAPAAPVQRSAPICAGPRVLEAIKAVQRAEMWTGDPIEIIPLETDPVGGIDLEGLLPAGQSLDGLITRRRSYRKPASRSAAPEQLAAFLRGCIWAYPASELPKDEDVNLTPGLVVIALDVKGLKRGVYEYDSRRRSLAPVCGNIDESKLSAACFGQDFVAGANAAAAIVVDFQRLRSAGAYRAALADAGAVGQLAYLSAEALGGGCCGVGAFFDDELNEVLSIEGGDRTAVYLLTLSLR